MTQNFQKQTQVKQDAMTMRNISATDKYLTMQNGMVHIIYRHSLLQCIEPSGKVNSGN